MKPAVGTEMETALWYNANEPKDKDEAKKGIETVFVQTAYHHGVQFGPIQWEDVDPFSPRVPNPPKYMKNARALIGVASVYRHMDEAPNSFFTEDLSPGDLKELRRRTSDAFEKISGFPLSDEECDEFINEHGPGVAGAEIMRLN